MELTTKNANSLKGKTIRWSAPSASGNTPYGGVSKIKKVNLGVIEATTIKGDDLSYAFLEKTDQGTVLDEHYNYSDVGRGITFSITEDE